MVSETLKDLFAVSLLCLLMTAGVSAQSKKSDAQHDGLIGKVRSVRSEIAKVSCKSGNCVEGSRSSSAIIDYDPNGNLTQAYIPGFQPHHSFAYTADGDRLERQSGSRMTKPLTTSDFGFPTEVYINVSFYRWAFKYDDLGNRTDEARYKRTSRALFGAGIMSAVALGKVSYKYNQDGRMAEASHYNSNGSLSRRVIYEYGEQGSIAIETEVKPSGKVANKRHYSYEYDARGNWIKRTTSMLINQKSRPELLAVEVVYREISYY